MKSYLKIPTYILTLIIALSLTLFSSENFAQNNLRLFEDIGGNGSSTQQTSSDDNTFIYVAGGLIVAGIVAYVLLVKKDKKEEIPDTTASLNTQLIYSAVDESNSSNDNVVKAKENLPIDIFIGMKNSAALLNDKTYLIGLRVKL